VFGDECLRELARLCAEVAESRQAQAARYGGEEFVLLLPGCSLHDAQQCGERLCRSIEALAIGHPASAVADHVTVSIGASAAFPEAALAPQILIAAADHALYAAKASGRNGVVAQPYA
jgi:diguanylate cyclase (GGDEF)-like protein